MLNKNNFKNKAFYNIKNSIELIELLFEQIYKTKNYKIRIKCLKDRIVLVLEIDKVI